jgi:hypothetical protein
MILNWALWEFPLHRGGRRQILENLELLDAGLGAL